MMVEGSNTGSKRTVQEYTGKQTPPLSWRVGLSLFVFEKCKLDPTAFAWAAETHWITGTRAFGGRSPEG